MIKIDCKKYANDILEQVSRIEDKGDLVIITTDHDPASQAYVRGKIKDAEKCGINAIKRVVNSEDAMVKAIRYASYDEPEVSGVIVQLPLPKGYDEDKLVNLVSIYKDVDGFQDDSPFEPCTPEGIMYILRKELGDLTGKTALVVGRGKLIGMPMIARLLAANCTVTIAHSKTRDLDSMLQNYDIIVSGVGVPGLIDLKKCNAEIVIDAGIGMGDGKLRGDCCNFDPDDNSKMKVATIPNGIGLLTRAMLMAHVARLELV
jgi:methylenetetrahydrofolate dehydrogenase (NADP+)/methenyltetrahydrofolate cyclohydrolase